MELIQSVSPAEWGLIAVSALLIGMNKTGLLGSAMIAIPILAAIFGARESVGLILPMLIAADIVAVIHYRRHAEWGLLVKLIPWALAGLAVGVVVGDLIPEENFQTMLAIVVIGAAGLLAYKEFVHPDLTVPERWWVAAILGLLAGFATMVGNAAGPLMTLYLLSMGLQKNRFIGTGAWFYLLVNVIKVPLHVIFWGTITWQTVTLNLITVPVIVAGGFLGLFLVKRIRERPYRMFVLAVTFIGSIRLFF
jgi:uncharacterized membrane protein YfcA